MNDQIKPAPIQVPDAELKELKDRLDRTRWAPEPVGGDVGYGTSNARVRELVTYWKDRYDWRAWEAKLNAYPHYETEIDGTRVHFGWIKSPEPNAIPLILCHGWPGSVFEYVNVLGPLSDPRAHGLDPSLAFDLVLPSLPGFGFSGPTTDTGWGVGRIAAAFVELMRRIGYTRYGTVGNDWGCGIAPEMGRLAPDAVIGAHVTEAWFDAPDDPELIAGLTPRDRGAMEAWQEFSTTAAYGMVHSEQPQSLAHAITDSPAGLVGWNVQCMGDQEIEAILTHASVHWLTNTAGSAIRIYAEAGREQLPVAADVPLGVIQFPHDLPSVRAFVERNHNLVSWTEADRGSHYGAYDAPDLLINDLRRFFPGLR
ncbi:epoxide hydrolase family protein [Microlunatus sp. GCM10028923]|uniref:epoxide hydrolase family protein n=1 Tax=Microlunatus sp. GCM10028923 TaxID=3273400 RepID=UPI00361938E4